MKDPVRDELEFHIEARTRELIAGGRTADEARREAEAAFGDLDAIRGEMRRLRRRRERRIGGRALAETAAAGVRGLFRRPGYAALVTVILTLGIGATVAVFSVFDAVVLSELPFGEPDRLVRVWQADSERPTRNPAPADFIDTRREIDAFESVTAFVPRGGNLLGDAAPERVRYADVAANFFHTLRIALRQGPGFGPETVPEGTRLAVVSHRLWTRRWGAAPDVVGRTLDLDGIRHEIVGVAPTGFAYPADVDLWVAAPYDVPAASFFGADAPSIRDAWYHTVVARLAPRQTAERAGDQLATLAAELAAAHPVSFGSDTRFWLTPLHTDQIGDRRTPLALLLGATLLVLLIVAANVANLSLVRTVDRAAEWGVRLALGAPRSRLAVLVLAENLALALAGGLGGLGLAALAIDALRPAVEPLLPVTATLEIDMRVVALALMLATTTAVVFSLAPAWAATRRAPATVLDRGAGARGPRRRDRRLRDALVASEVAFAVVLVLGAGLLLRSLAVLRATEMGFDYRSLITMSVGFPGSTEWGAEAQAEYYRTLTERLRAVDGVGAVAWGQLLPSEVGAGAGLRIEGRTAPGEETSVRWQSVSTGYFTTIGARSVEGRFFEPGDGADAEPAAVVNRTLARRFFPDGDALGARVNTGLDGRTDDDWTWVRIVGIVEDTRNLGPARPAEPMLYRPLSQQPPGFVGGPRGVLHIRPDGAVSIADVRSVIQVHNPDAPVDEILRGAEIIAAWTAPQRFVLSLIGAFAGLALALGAVGIYGLTRHAVQRRTREIGVRMAIGAGSRGVVSLVVRQALAPALVGLAAGLAISVAARGLVESRLVGVRALDPVTWVAVPVLLLAVALASTWLPARRAAAIDPVRAMRQE
jgi:predicted permease